MDTVVLDRVDLRWLKVVARKRYELARTEGLDSREAVVESFRYAFERYRRKTKGRGPDKAVSEAILGAVRDGAGQAAQEAARRNNGAVPRRRLSL